MSILQVHDFLFCWKVHLCRILDSRYNWYHMVFVFLFLTYFTSMRVSSCIHVAENGIILFLFTAHLNLSTEKKIMDLENKLVVASGDGERVGWLGSLGLTDADYCLWNGLAMRSCCVALGTMSSYLWWSMIMWEKRMHICMCNWVSPCCIVREKNVLGK